MYVNRLITDIILLGKSGSEHLRGEDRRRAALNELHNMSMEKTTAKVNCLFELSINFTGNLNLFSKVLQVVITM